VDRLPLGGWQGSALLLAALTAAYDLAAFYGGGKIGE
jgi:hypothetical protein